MAQVIVAAARKWRVGLPSDPNQLHEVEPNEYVAKGRFPISHTPILRFLDKAATNDGSTSRWKLCPVTQVEETKLMIGLLPVWVSLLIPGTQVSIGSSIFINQAATLNRKIVSHFEIPVASFTFFLPLTTMITIIVYDRVLVRIFRRFTGNPRGITILQRMGIGIFLSIVTLAVSSITDLIRINSVKEHDLEGNAKAVSPLTIFILLPQCLLGGISEAFLEPARTEFFYDQAPESMQSIGAALYATTYGFGGFLATFLLTITTKISGRKGHTRWILDNLNASRVCNFYAFLAVLFLLNFIYFLVASRLYVYKRETNEAFGNYIDIDPVTVTVERRAVAVDIKNPAVEMDLVNLS